jgi:hypothetical protein
MPRGSSAKRERQYEHIRDSARSRGASTTRAKEIAARTVNKQRSQSGETKSRSPRGRTRDQLYAEAKRLGVKGRSSMNKEQLRRAVDARK